MRFLFYAVWVVSVPLLLAVANVWLLTPSSSGGGQPLRDFVAEQQLPVGIVLFTLFAMVLWRFRHDLPLASSLGVDGRRDIPPKARARFEDAAALLDEAQRILRTRKRDVERELTEGEREQVEQALRALERTMSAERFDFPAFDAAHSRADKVVGEYLGRWRKGEMREYAESIGIAVAIALILRAFVVEAFKIPSGSMIPTLMVGDHIFVNKLTYGPLIPWTDRRLYSQLPPARGDVMVFKFPENEDQDFIKRTIALPGDTLEAINGRPILNGWLAPHCYVGPYRYDGRQAELFVEYLEDRSYFTLYDENPDEQVCKTESDCNAGLVCRKGLCGVLQGPFKVAPKEAWVMGDNRNNSHDSRSWRGGLGAGVPFENMKGRATFVWMSVAPGGGFALDRLFVNVMGRPKLPGNLSERDLAKLQETLDQCLRERPSVAETTPPVRTR
ncbi:Signal peptidase I [Chondromyces apiculatus DSM 436]|uniref:Signal peptidase I n=1 Tax=Chondromyces apiculatus DSM 436 TaxID=1192034 RepID=A0A017TAP2_9BACT|nr:Signal peptidase I [Chondromyces apiculatus DSM 436]